MATVFWDSRGIIFTDYLEKGRTITGQYYADLLDRFDAELMKKRPHLAKKKVLFHHDNAPAHSSAIATAKLVELRYELLPHPPYSPDLAPCNFFLFPNMKKWLGGKRFTSKVRGSHRRNRGLFCGVQQTIFFGWLEKVRISLD